ncbi:cytochrome P450 3A18-like [Mercenaria mercenaria]|uniref:cytochrome P450 3A18-like n=1 Tax=Mercenaria mercenaria TaxID=6596 RepID=UPI00234F4C1F|nr:cytochrome P450 3A18-like [Mercenaria mercenaria]XP_045184473.2 cytochrome P450 3A18-like [Mercenaria mercenaria]
MAFSLEVNSYLVLVFLGMCVTFIYRYMVDTYSTLERLGIPGPKPVWIFGNVLEFKGKNVLHVFDEWKQTFGKVYGFYEGFRPGIVVNDVDFARDVLNRHFEKFHIRTSYRPFVYYPDNLRLIELDGEHWKNQRAVINKMVNSTGILKRVIEKIQVTSNKMLQQFADEVESATEGFNISNVIDTYVSEGVMRVVLNSNEEQMSKHQESIHNYEVLSNWSASAENEAAGLARLFPCLTPLLKLADKKHRESHEVVVNILREYLRNALTGQNNNKNVDDDNVSFLPFLLSSKVLCRELDGSLARRGLTSDETIAHILSLLSEMYSTTTAVIQFILYELACNKNCQDQLYDEILRICGQNEDISMAELQNMEYFDMFFNETYRHHPIAPGISRVCTESCTIRGVTFKKGMVVRVMTSPMYKDDTLFHQPEKFIPDRFSKVNRQNQSHQYSFLPFGQGPRKCPGQKLAMIQVKLAIINIVRNYTLDTGRHTKIPVQEALRPSLTPAHGVHIKMSKRF